LVHGGKRNERTGKQGVAFPLYWKTRKKEKKGVISGNHEGKRGKKSGRGGASIPVSLYNFCPMAQEGREKGAAMR